MKKKITLAQARAAYVHRFTMEHVPQWAKGEFKPRHFYAPHFRSDAEWYANTVFPGESGHYGPKDSCNTSGQTWPLGKSLPAPFSKLTPAPVQP